MEHKQAILRGTYFWNSSRMSKKIFISILCIYTVLDTNIWKDIGHFEGQCDDRKVEAVLRRTAALGA